MFKIRNLRMISMNKHTHMNKFVYRVLLHTNNPTLYKDCQILCIIKYSCLKIENFPKKLKIKKGFLKNKNQNKHKIKTLKSNIEYMKYNTNIRKSFDSQCQQFIFMPSMKLKSKLLNNI